MLGSLSSLGDFLFGELFIILVSEDSTQKLINKDLHKFSILVCVEFFKVC